MMMILNEHIKQVHVDLSLFGIWQINVNNVWITYKINVTQIQVHMKLRGLNLEIKHLAN